ncbi:MAG: metallophosphoesterase, partial [Thermotogaceae bacterium]|nr:metallophosphoesterase [Thermotogaceae bacterium]
MRKLLVLLLVLSLVVLSLAGVVAKKITSAEELIGGPAADGKVGDYLMKNNIVSFIIGDKDNYHGYMRSGGNVLDAAPTGTRYDLLDEFHTYFGWPKQLIAEKIEIVNDGRDGKAAIIKVEGHHSHIDGVRVTSWYILDPGVNYLKVVTQLVNNSGKDIENIILGDAAYFGYARTFLWGMGFNLNRFDSLLLGAQGDGLAYGFSTTELDSQTGKMRKIHISYIFADPEIKTVTLKNGESVTYERLFFVARDLATIQKEILDMRGIDYTLLRGYAYDDRGNTLANTRIEVIDEIGTVYSVAYTNAAGMYEVPLLNGEYKVVVNVEGMETVSDVEVEANGEGAIFAPALVAKYADQNKFVWSPYINNAGKDFVEISFRTLVPSSGKVVVDGVGGFADGKVAKLHHVKVTGLKPGTTYTYKVVLGSEKTMGIESEPHTFKTFSDESKFRFVVYGDTRTYNKRHKIMADAIDKYNPDFVLHVGDLVMDGRIIDDWNGFFWAIKNLAADHPFFVDHGNHEYNSVYFYQAFNFRLNNAWYSFDYGDAHFIVLNADTLLMQKDFELFMEETKWLEKDLEKHKDAKFKFVFFHEPFRTNCTEYGEEPESPTAKYWEPIFERYGVDIIFNSHYHFYERLYKDGIVYITTGGGGAPLYEHVRENPLSGTKKVATALHHFVVVDVNGDEATVKVVAVARQTDKEKEDGYELIEPEVIDQFTIKK